MFGRKYFNTTAANIFDMWLLGILVQNDPFNPGRFSIFGIIGLSCSWIIYHTCMKKAFLLSSLLLTVIIAVAQKNKVDSFMSLLRVERVDTGRVTLLWKAANAQSIYSPDSALKLAQEALYLAEKIKYIEGESRALGITANTFLKIGNYPKALEFYLRKLKIEEKRDNPFNLSSVIMNIGIVYVYQEEYRKALDYLFQADSVITANKVEALEYNIALNIGDVYNRLNSNDSAFIFYSRSLALAKKQEDVDLTGTSMVGLGHSYFKRGNDSMALENYHGALLFLQQANDEELICEASIGLAKLYNRMGRSDSAEHYARSTFQLARKDGFLSWELEATSFLTDHYKELGRSDSALVYLEQKEALKDSINSKERIRHSQILSSDEQLRQAELAEAKRKAKEERSKQLQFLFIGIFIPGIFLLTLFLSRIRVHIRLIKLMGILSLLILFEYLTLLLHPYVLELTHHTPVYEIMIFVAIAAVLIPTHHRIEHWLIHKLTHKRGVYSKGEMEIRKAKLKTKKPSA